MHLQLLEVHALLGVGAQHVFDEVLELRGGLLQFLEDLPEAVFVLLVEADVVGVLQVRAVEGRGLHHHHEEGAHCGKEVGVVRVVGLVLAGVGDLGGVELGRAHGDAGTVGHALEVLVQDAAGEAEVRYLQVVVLVDQEVLSLDVAVAQSLLVQVLEA